MKARREAGFPFSGLEMLSLKQKLENLYFLDILVERLFLPRFLSTDEFPCVNSVLAIMRSFNLVLTHGLDSENLTPGQFRNNPVRITNAPHLPPPAEKVEELTKVLAEEIVQKWNDGPSELHAYVLWRLNWIHPFLDGNGRTARAFSYFLLCVKFGKLLPGKDTITSLIQQNKQAHYEALRQADAGDLGPMEEQSARYLRAQLAQAVSR